MGTRVFTPPPSFIRRRTIPSKPGSHGSVMLNLHTYSCSRGRPMVQSWAIRATFTDIMTGLKLKNVLPNPNNESQS